jgi:hypothetical protein
MPRQKSFASMKVDELLELRNSLDKYLGEKREQLLVHWNASAGLISVRSLAGTFAVRTQQRQEGRP